MVWAVECRFYKSVVRVHLAMDVQLSLFYFSRSGFFFLFFLSWSGCGCGLTWKILISAFGWLVRLWNSFPSRRIPAPSFFCPLPVVVVHFKACYVQMLLIHCLICLACLGFLAKQDLAVVVLLILIPLISPNSSKGGVSINKLFAVLWIFLVSFARC